MGQPRRRQVRQALIAIVATVSLTGCASVSLQTQNAREERPFFQQEQETEIHGRKNWLDYLVEADPGTFQVETASDYQERPPAVLAVLPFGDVGDANFTIDKIPITFRNKEQQERWAWTDAQRLRLSVMGHLAQREFRVVNPIAVDAVLKQLGIDSMNKLKRVSPLKLGRLLAADAVVYGEVDNYEGYYFGIVSAYHVAVSMWMTSTHDGEMLMHAKGGRYSVDLEPALSPQDFAINSIKTLLSVKTLLEFRDITLARAEEEVGRELVLRIPVSETLKMQLAKRALEKAQEADSDEEAASQDNPHAMNTVLSTTLPLGSRHGHAVREYTEVHQDLARVARNYDRLTPTERHEPNDDLCLTEYLIGRWSYPLSEQERTCSEALTGPGSVNGAILARIHEATKRSAAKEVRRALEAQDLPDAEAAALAYGASPGADSELLAGWSKDIWQVVHRPKRSAERERQVASVIAELANEYPQAKTMSEPDFTHWVIAASIVPNKSLVSRLRIKEDTLDLLVSKDDLPTVATNLYRFVRINDAFAARCGCDARTNIGIADVGFPAYLFRLDPEERTSKILIAIGAPAVGPTRPVSPSPGQAVAQPLETRPATESSQEAQTAAKRSRAATLEGMTGGGGTGALGSSPLAGSASSPQQPAPREQPKLKSTGLESESDFQPSSSQPFQGPTSKANPQRLDFPTPPPDAVAHALPTGASFLRSRSSDEATARGGVNDARGLSAQQDDDTLVSSYIAR